MSDYTFRLDKVVIRDTRSHHEDTNLVGFAVKVNDQMFGPVIKGMGNVNNGDHPLNMEIGPVSINVENDIVTICYQIWNNGNQGHPNGYELNTKLNEVMPDLKFDDTDPDNPTSGDPTPGEPLGTTGGSFSDKLLHLADVILFTGLHWAFDNCDGPVALKKVTLFQDDLHSRTRNNQRNDSEQDSFKGGPLKYGVPCNSGNNNQGSDYTVFWSITR
jgi:hypothetical protein